ncbi:mercury resistance system periplasmic binding protein MerP [Marinobacter sp. C2H3]|uniref:mercury resistance system periplasmic binding protein MerP n=1 Tax=Marinobacter sp. C2H3 TaxID=3119003 RepID=UPI00300E8F16
MKLRLVVMLFVTLISLPTWAATQTVTLAVPGMTCAACPVTVKMALGKVDGVSKIEVNYPDREAVVTFDDDRTSVAALTEATRDAGYPSALKSPQATGDRP